MKPCVNNRMQWYSKYFLQMFMSYISMCACVVNINNVMDFNNTVSFLLINCGVL